MLRVTDSTPGASASNLTNCSDSASEEVAMLNPLGSPSIGNTRPVSTPLSNSTARASAAAISVENSTSTPPTDRKS